MTKNGDGSGVPKTPYTKGRRTLLKKPSKVYFWPSAACFACSCSSSSIVSFMVTLPSKNFVAAYSALIASSKISCWRAVAFWSLTIPPLLRTSLWSSQACPACKFSSWVIVSFITIRVSKTFFPAFSTLTVAFSKSYWRDTAFRSLAILETLLYSKSSLSFSEAVGDM